MFCHWPCSSGSLVSLLSLVCIFKTGTFTVFISSGFHFYFGGAYCHCLHGRTCTQDGEAISSSKMFVPTCQTNLEYPVLIHTHAIISPVLEALSNSEGHVLCKCPDHCVFIIKRICISKQITCLLAVQFFKPKVLVISVFIVHLLTCLHTQYKTKLFTKYLQFIFMCFFFFFFSAYTFHFCKVMELID
jgi:hypothetical protein